MKRECDVAHLMFELESDAWEWLLDNGFHMRPVNSYEGHHLEFEHPDQCWAILFLHDNEITDDETELKVFSDPPGARHDEKLPQLP